METVVGTSAAARVLELSATRVLELVKEGSLVPAFKSAEGYHYFRVPDLQNFKRERQARKQRASAQ